MPSEREMYIKELESKLKEMEVELQELRYKVTCNKLEIHKYYYQPDPFHRSEKVLLMDASVSAGKTWRSDPGLTEIFFEIENEVKECKRFHDEIIDLIHIRDLSSIRKQ